MGNISTEHPTQQDFEAIQEIIDVSLAIDEESFQRKIDKMRRFIQFLFAPTLVGAENIPDGPALFVANHSTMAADVLVAMPLLTHAAGRAIRGMSDEIMYRYPKARRHIAASGAVMGNQAIGDALFDVGKDVLLFPGGAHEANKDLSERYEIKWKERTGFVRLAARHGVPIVPVGIVGPDEWFGRYMDRDEVRHSFVGKLMSFGAPGDDFLQSDQVPPIPKGLFGTMIPKPKRAYLAIGEPVDTLCYKSTEPSLKAQRALRDQVRERLRGCIDDMLRLQAQESDKTGMIRKLLTI